MSKSNPAAKSSEEAVPQDAPSGEDAAGESPPVADQIAVLEQDLAVLKDQLLRRRAEFDNYRRRVERDRSLAGDDAVIALLSNLLPSLDVLEKALAADGTAHEIRAGVSITLKEISTTLGNRGVKVEDPTGSAFDPLRHEALSYEPAPGAEDGSVVACYRKGYLLGDRLIRPALVKVAQRTPEEPPALVLTDSN